MRFLFSNKNRPQKILGLTLMELVVSVALFAILILVATKTFTKITDIQNRAKDKQNIEGDLRYAMGVFVDEVRAASRHINASVPNCPDAACDAKYFCTNATGSILYLQDTSNHCVTYSQSGNNLVVSRGNTSYTITSNYVIVNSVQFLPSALSDRILIKFKASGVSDYNKSISYQTAITSTSTLK